LSYRHAKGFFFTFDALMSLAAIAAMTSALVVMQEKPTLDQNLLYQVAQDAAEACSIKQDWSDSCFSVIKQVSRSLSYCTQCEHNGARIERLYGLEKKILVVWADDD